jgi:hypothetical protein
LDVFLYDFFKTVTLAALICVIPLVIGLAVSKPIRVWVCFLATAAPLIIFVIYPMATHRMDGAGGLLGTFGFFFCLYGLSRRKGNNDNVHKEGSQ